MIKRFFSSLDWPLVFLWVALSFGILVRAYFNHEAWMSSDAMHYLQLAQNLLNHQGFFVTDVGVASGKNLFAIWPVLYPVLIYGVAKLTFFPVMWAAKVVNILCLGGCFVLLRRQFGAQSVFFALTFAFTSMIAILGLTWSEVPFFLGLMMLVQALRSYQTRPSGWNWVAIVCAGLWLFLCRYIGIFSLLSVGLLSLWGMYRREYWKAVGLGAAAVVILAGCVGYMGINKHYTRHGTGMARVPTPYSWTFNVRRISGSIVAQINPLFEDNGNPKPEDLRPWTLSFIASFLIIAGCLIVSPRMGGAGPVAQSEESGQDYERLYVILGLCYLVFLSYLTLTTDLTSEFRYFRPVLLLFSFATLSFGFRQFPSRSWGIRWAMILLAGLSFMMEVPAQLAHDFAENTLTYPEILADIIPIGRALLPGSLLVCDAKDESLTYFSHLPYLRTDLESIEAEGVQWIHPKLSPCWQLFRYNIRLHHLETIGGPQPLQALIPLMTPYPQTLFVLSPVHD